MGEKIKVLELAKATVYRSSMFGWTSVEANDVSVEKGPYAQYKEALHVSYRRPRKRSREGFVASSYEPGHSVVVIAGWGHPDFIAGALEANGDGSSITRHSSFSPEWTKEFRASLQAFRERSKVPLEIYDYLGDGV